VTFDLLLPINYWSRGSTCSRRLLQTTVDRRGLNYRPYCVRMASLGRCNYFNGIFSNAAD